jgi:hypothetical protein
MIDLKCVRCGSTNLVAGEVCQACAIEMPPATGPLARSTLFVPYLPLSKTNSAIEPFYGVGSVLGPTFRLFADNFWLITKLTLVIVAPFQIFKALSIGDIAQDWQYRVGMFLLEALCNVLIAPALIFALMKVMQTGIAPGVNQCYRWGFSKLGKLAICVFVASMLQAMGIALCFLPGVYAMVVLSLVAPLAVLEKGSASVALLDSNELTKGHRWKILVAGIVIYSLWGIIGLPVYWLSAILGASYFTFWPQPVAEIIMSILGQATTILSLVIYLSIRRTLEEQGAQ